ncbi:TBC domain-containing protein [Colletotrichum graminicola M1.001]|uniref:TBC domain-containing protein n=1 Tax=Colletotrichum graminicola (strain M1.001 / M2 / FGSC 10212) TaxID=645133 RepID=E3QXF2_COLGM|nr:TBC domain-containing protein [Colletotrichum graminicola M1.001]EFQ35540.1 TBC domain-containing protein [Colletotrichum graminicola M1.001]
MIYGHQDVDLAGPSPGSPPGMTSSKSSKSSSFKSFHSDDNSVLDDVSHFEDIGLEDDASHYDTQRIREASPAKSSQPYSRSYSTDFRPISWKPPNSRSPPMPRDLAKPRGTSGTAELTSNPRSNSLCSRPAFPTLRTDSYILNRRSPSAGRLSDSRRSPVNPRNFTSRSTTSLNFPRTNRSPSPNFSFLPRDPNIPLKPRRGSCHSPQDKRKSVVELERECDEDDTDDIPDGLILDNVPISPRPRQDRTPSRPTSSGTSPNRPPKERGRSVGNGTPPVPVDSGRLRSPSWKSDTALSSTGEKGAPEPLKNRARSWNLALAELNADAKELTEKLEEHSDHLREKAAENANPTGRHTWNGKSFEQHSQKPRVKSALPELPSIRHQTNIMIDPLPISKEKEAVLSRTRPSWLPPKDPAEEKRHLREYKKMMARSAEADRRREDSRQAKKSTRDTKADSLMRIWDDEIVPRWTEAVRERRTRELWWKGIAPRSRGTVWAKAIGNELGLSEKSYNAALRRAQELEERVNAGKGDSEDMQRAAWLSAIRNDVAENTWQDLRIFQVGGPLHQTLVDVLFAYALYRSDIGYVKGCNTLAALLLLNLPSSSATFIALANVLNRPLPLSFYSEDPGAKASAYNLVMQTLSVKSPRLHQHLTKDISAGDADFYLGNFFMGLGTTHLAMDEAARLWDVYVFEGDAVMVRAAVAILMRNEMALLGVRSAGEAKKMIEGGANKDGRKAVVGDDGAEDRWMRAVREAGKA